MHSCSANPSDAINHRRAEALDGLHWSSCLKIWIVGLWSFEIWARAARFSFSANSVFGTAILSNRKILARMDDHAVRGGLYRLYRGRAPGRDKIAPVMRRL